LKLVTLIAPPMLVPATLAAGVITELAASLIIKFALDVVPPDSVIPPFKLMRFAACKVKLPPPVALIIGFNPLLAKVILLVEIKVNKVVFDQVTGALIVIFRADQVLAAPNVMALL
jgi:hypothetical protein